MFSVLLKTSVQVALQWWLYKNNEMRGRKRHVYIYNYIYNGSQNGYVRRESVDL